MHRSGTSFATRALELLGVSLGAPTGLLVPGPDNPAGYFENRSIQELNDELLAHLGGAWDRPPVLSGAWADDEGLDAFRIRAATILADDFGAAIAEGRTIGFKDPRVSLLLPFWRTVRPVSATLVLVRDPGEVAASLARRDGIDAPQAALLWLRYLLAAATNDPEHLLVGLPDFFDDLGPTLARIARHLDLEPPAAAVEAAVRDHLDPSLRHHVAGDEDPDGDASNPIVELAARVWNRGRPDLSIVDPTVGRALSDGWWRPPSDEQELARARAEAISFREQLKRRNEIVKALKEGRRPPDPLPPTPVIELDPDDRLAPHDLA
jgi:hypothetical protein